VLPQVLYPAMNELLCTSEWEWFDATLQRITYDEAEMAAFLHAYERSKAAAEQRRAERVQQQAADRDRRDDNAPAAAAAP
jgi:hypothetical protein